MDTNVQSITNRVLDNVRRVIVGKDNEIRLTFLAMLCEGHLLIEDVPGVGKTIKLLFPPHRLPPSS